MLAGEARNREELMQELRAAKDNGLLSADTLAMIEGAIAVSDKQVADVMVPRSQMVTVPIEADLPEVLRIMLESGHSRFPVCGEDKDEIIGVLLAKDLLRCLAEQQAPCNIRGLVRGVRLIPENKPLNVLLKEFRQSRHHLAMVIDEYGGVSGLVTIEDVLEEIVGDIDDEHDDEANPDLNIRPMPDGRFSVNAVTLIEDFNQRFDTNFPNDDFDTIGGMVTHTLGRLPLSGEEIILGAFRFHVTKADKRRVLQLTAERCSKS
ncbi:MAG: CBS domain-containing protein [Ahniella sp.]|nr:CBS domain-containing protein [Ahniella sp.]